MATKEQKLQEAQEAIGVDTEAMSTEKEFDLIGGFLRAAEMIKGETTPIEIRRNGELLIKFNIHALTAHDLKAAKKKATTMMPNPANKKLPPIEKSSDRVIYESYLIYLATTAEDRANLWDNPEIKKQFNVMEGYELIDVALYAGEKSRIIDAIDTISGFDGDTFENAETMAENENIETSKNS